MTGGLSHYATLLLLATTTTCVTNAFITPSSSISKCNNPTTTALSMALDPVTYLRTEWVSAALCTNQTPRSADKVLQLGVEDGRAVNFVPRTVRDFITSSAEKKDGPENGGLTVSCERQLKQMAERRRSAAITYSNQPVDNLIDTPSSSIDVVISLQSAQRMAENGYDWKRSISEAGRVLKPGGRFLFVESATVNGESYLDEVVELSDFSMENKKQGDDDADEGIAMNSEAADDEGGNEEDEEEEEENNKATPIFEEVGYDQVDMVLQPHIAGVAIKAMDADLSASQKAQLKSQEESDRLAELSLNAFERGNKSRRKRKKKKTTGGKGGAGEGMGME